MPSSHVANDASLGDEGIHSEFGAAPNPIPAPKRSTIFYMKRRNRRLQRSKQLSKDEVSAYLGDIRTYTLTDL